jgi:hypothetical protein
MIQADISRQHAEFLREAQGIVLIAYAETTVNGKSGSSFLLKDGDHIAMRTVEFTYHQPLAWSKTARLEIVSRHRLPLGLNGVLLMSETCVVGGPKSAHIPAPWESPVVVSWNRDQYWLRAPGEIHLDGVPYSGWGPLSSTAVVKGAWGSFRWEPISMTHGFRPRFGNE